MDPKTLVIGLGNPILTDDAVGIRVVRALQEAGLPDGVDALELSVGGLRLMESMTDYGRVVLVDAIMTQGGEPGAVYDLTLDQLPGTLNTSSAHDTNLATALRIGRRLGAALPADAHVKIVAVEAADVLTFGERCTPAVEAAVPVAVRRVQAILADLLRLCL
ncbi:MAG: hydrogenase maturation protease [Anaerolineae bacterium]|nr:hydrogenase maturation protease [Anaerolineae bacterium]